MRASNGTLPRGLPEFVRALTTSCGATVLSVVLFGSWARGEARPDSDIDLLIVAADLPAARLDRFRLWRRVALEVLPDLARRLAVILLSAEEAKQTRPFYLDLVHEAVLLYDRDGFFREVLSALGQRLAHLGAKRARDRHGHPYWILKEASSFGEVVEL
jgi:uncharacterized protein